MHEVLIHFRLVGDEAQALQKLAVNESRHPRDQVKYILRRQLEKLGLLPITNHEMEVQENEKTKQIE